ESLMTMVAMSVTCLSVLLCPSVCRASFQTFCPSPALPFYYILHPESVNELYPRLRDPDASRQSVRAMAVVKYVEASRAPRPAVGQQSVESLAFQFAKLPCLPVVKVPAQE